MAFSINGTDSAHNDRVITSEVSRTVTQQLHNGELSDTGRLLIAQHWVSSTLDLRVYNRRDDIDINVDTADEENNIETQQQECITPENETSTSTVLPVEDITLITSFAKLADVKRVATKFHAFKGLEGEGHVEVLLRNMTTMRLPYRNIRFVESYLFRMQHEDDEQRDYMQNRDMPMYYSDNHDVTRLDDIERAIVMHLLSYDKCSNEILVAFLNMKLHQLSAFTYEIIRRELEMVATIVLSIGEYLDVTERQDINGVIANIEPYDPKLSKEVYCRWKQQYELLQSREQILIDCCVDEDTQIKRVKEDETTKFYHKVVKEINAVTHALIPSDVIIKTYNTLCRPVHLLQLSEAAYAMSTVTLLMEIQRKIDFVSLLVIEHNMRAQTRKLSFGKEFYHLAMENTILASELVGCQLFYTPRLQATRRVTQLRREIEV